MSDKRWLSMPRGWKVEQPGHDPNRVGSVGPLRRADKDSLRLARRNLREIAEQDVEGQGRYLLDKTTGDTLEVVTSFVDVIEPKTSGVEAFVVRDGWFVPLRPIGWTHPDDKSTRQGEVFGRKAEDNDPMPIPSELRVY
jgi:hypothetical protein